VAAPAGFLAEGVDEHGHAERAHAGARAAVAGELLGGGQLRGERDDRDAEREESQGRERCEPPASPSRPPGHRHGETQDAGNLAGATFSWAIAMLDLGVFLPATVATCVGLVHGSAWAHKALYLVAGWFGLVAPPWPPWRSPCT
jgi:hypothetical protein